MTLHVRKPGANAAPIFCNIAKRRQKHLKILMQGGGSRIAYLIGFLSEILSDRDCKIVEMSGTSASAILAVVVADILNQHKDEAVGRKKAIETLQGLKKMIVDETASTMTLLEMLDPAYAWRETVKLNMSMSAPWLKAWGLPPVHKAEYDPHLPALEHLIHAQSLGRAFNHWATMGLKRVPLLQNAEQILNRITMTSGYIATYALHNIVSRAATLEDNVFVHAAQGNVRVSINTAEVQDDGKTLNHRVFTGQELTVDSVMGSAGLEYFEPIMIDAKRQLDGGYLRNCDIESPLNSPMGADVIAFIGTNRPKTEKIVPKLQSALTTDDLRETDRLVADQAYAEVILRADEARRMEKTASLGRTTFALSTYNHCPAWGPGSKQNTKDHFMNLMEQDGREDARAFLAREKNNFGVTTTVRAETLEDVARNARHWRPRQTLDHAA